MAFTTEFVMGAGGAEVEEIPVSMSGGGRNSYPLATVDAGNGAFLLVTGTMTPGSTSNSGRPQLQMGTHLHAEPHLYLTGALPSVLPGGYFTGVVELIVLSHTTFSTSFTGTVHVIRV